MAFRITAPLREFYRYTGVSADIERKGKGQSRETTMLSNVELARAYIKAIEAGATGDSLAGYFTPEAIIREMPNRTAPHGSVSSRGEANDGSSVPSPLTTCSHSGE